MHLLEISTILFALTKVTYAWGTPQQRPPAAWTVSQGNQCGNGVTPYCCNNEAKNGGYTDCTAMGKLWHFSKYYVSFPNFQFRPERRL